MSQAPAKLSRRVYLQQGVALGAFALAAPFAIGCGKKELNCSDAQGLSGPDAQTRTSLAYVDKSTTPNQECDGCQQYKPAGDNQCGGCQVVKGPINPKGWCKSWVKKTT